MRRLLLAAAVALATASDPLLGQNLLTNPGFDTSLDGWSPFSGAQRSPLDANGSTHSGSAWETIGPGVSRSTLLGLQCVPVSGGTTYDFSAKVKTEEPGLSAGDAIFYGSSDCTTSLLVMAGIYTANSPAGQFQKVHAKVVAPPEAHSAQIVLGASTNGGSTTHDAFFDDIYFGPPAPATCTPSATNLCIDLAPGDRRFMVVVPYASSQSGGLSGRAQAISLASLAVNRGGLFWFFSADNPELLVKVLDGCGLTNFRWVFLSAGTNVGADVLVGDTSTGEVALFHNPDLGAFPSVQDVFALGCH